MPRLRRSSGKQCFLLRRRPDKEHCLTEDDQAVAQYSEIRQSSSDESRRWFSSRHFIEKDGLTLA